MIRKTLPLTLAVVLAASSAAFAIVTFDPGTGTGFVGKGDVQLIYGWNNKQLQSNAGAVQFQASSVEVTTATWTCDRDAGPQTQERANTTTTTIQGVVSSIARERNQITGFILDGYSGEIAETEEKEGPEIGTCPTGWTAIDLVEVTEPASGGGLQVSSDGTNWSDLQ